MEQLETLGMLWDRVMHGLSTQVHAAYDRFWNIPISAVGQAIVSVFVASLIMGALAGGLGMWGNSIAEKEKGRADKNGGAEAD